MIPEIKKYMLENWEKIESNHSLPRDISFLGIPGAGEGGTVTFLLFIDSKKDPIYALKIYRDDHFPLRVKTERIVLKKLALIPSLASTVPNLVIDKSFLGKDRTIIQNILKGEAMEVKIGANNLPPNKMIKKHFELVNDWLIKLGENTYSNELKKNDFHSIINTAKNIFYFSKEENRFIKKIENNINNLISYGSVIEHGDFCRQNILMTEESGRTIINIIDWSDCKNNGIPIADLITFLATYLLKLRKKIGVGGLIETFEFTFFQPNPYSTHIWKVINKYINHFKILIPDLPYLLGVILLRQACDDYNKLQYASMHGTLPGFTLSLVESEKDNIEDVIKRTPWFYLFQTLVKHYKSIPSLSKNIRV